jgi:polyhydroxybutyrate depolymerase
MRRARMPQLLALAWICAVGFAHDDALADACQSAPQQGSSVIQLSSDGIARNAVLHLPGAAAGHPLPLLIALHGYGGTGASFEQDTGFSRLADKDGFAVLYPSAHGPEWAINSSNRDVLFISQLLDRVSSLACVDARRIYATGVSNGGRMAALLGCALSERIAAIAPVSGGYRSLPACLANRPVSVLEIHGTADTTVPYEGFGPQHEGAVLSYMFAWAARDGCATQPSKLKVAAHTVRYLWSGCRGGATVEHLRIYGGEHGLPDADGAEISSGGSYTVSGAHQVWRFLAPIVLSPPNPLSPSSGGEGADSEPSS